MPQPKEKDWLNGYKNKPHIYVLVYWSPTIIVLLLISSFLLVSVCLTYCGAPLLGAYIFIIVISSLGLILWSLCSVLVCLFSQPLFESLFYLIWVLQLLLSFGLHLREIFFSSPSLLVCMCPLFWGGSLVDSTYRGLVFVSIQPVFVFWLGHSTHLHLR